MAAKELILVAPAKELKNVPMGFAPCYGRSSPFRMKGHLLEVEMGQRQVVSRALCVRRVYQTCKKCPVRDFEVELHV